MNAIAQYIIENATPSQVQEAVNSYSIPSICYKMASSISGEFNIKRNTTSFGIAVSEAMQEFKTDSILLTEVNHQINQLQNRLKVMSKYHTEYLAKCLEHDALVEINNKLSEPITKFLKLYKKAQKEKGKNIRVVKKSEPRINKPA